MRHHGGPPMSQAPHQSMNGKPDHGRTRTNWIENNGGPYGAARSYPGHSPQATSGMPASQYTGAPAGIPGSSVASGIGAVGGANNMYTSTAVANSQSNMMGGGPPGSAMRQGRVISAAEQVWMQIASTANVMGEGETAHSALELVLRHNPANYQAMLRLGDIFHNEQQYMQASEVYQRILSISESAPNSINPAIVGSAYSSLAHCFLLLDELPKAFHAYQQALAYPGANKDSTLWFGIGLLYDRYGADEHALEAFTAVLKIEGYIGSSSQPLNRAPTSLIREVYYRLGRLLRNRKQFSASLECFKFIDSMPPPPLTSADVSLQSAFTMDAQGHDKGARELLEQLISTHGKDATFDSVITKVKSILGWIQFRHATQKDENNPGLILLKETVEADPNDSLSWYFLGRAQFLVGAFNKSYEAYQEAVYREGHNAAFWNSIGVLYLETKQYRDALDAFSRAIQQNSSVPEIWWNLGLLYELCSNQLPDAIDAYQRAAELASESSTYMERLTLIKEVLATGAPAPAPPTESFEIDPLPWMMRPILFGNSQIPAQKATLPPSTLSILSSAMAISSNQAMAAANINANSFVRMPPLPGSAMRLPPGGIMTRPPPSFAMNNALPPSSLPPRTGQQGPYSLSLSLPQSGMSPMAPRYGPLPPQRSYVPPR